MSNSQQIYREAAQALAASADLLRRSVNQTAAILPGLQQQASSTFLLIVLVFLAGYFTTSVKSRYSKTRKNYPPGVPGGLPMLGNLLQVNTRKPHRTITDMAEKLGPIFLLKLGVIQYAVITSPELAKEVAVTKFRSVSKKSVLSAPKLWSKDKKILALSDYDDDYRKWRKLFSTQILASGPMKSLSSVRERLLKTVVDEVFWKVERSSGLVDVRVSIEHYIFPFLLHQLMGYVPRGVYVPEIGKLELRDMFVHLVVNPMKSMTTQDWRDFLPLFSWLPNPAFNKKVVDVEKLRSLVVRAIIEEKRLHLESQGRTGGFLEHMLTETDLSAMKVEVGVWELLVVGSEPNLTIMEWVMYELGKNQDIQNRLYQEIQKVVGSRMVTETDLPNLPLLDAAIKETLRLRTPIQFMPAREVEEDITLGGYHVPKGCQVLINAYGIGHDKKRWAKWDEWIPDRFLNSPELDLGIKDFQAIPFGLGNRRCGGTPQAITVIGSFVASFVQRFHYSLSGEDTAFHEETDYLSSQKLHPLEVIASPRSRHV